MNDSYAQSIQTPFQIVSDKFRNSNHDIQKIMTGIVKNILELKSANNSDRQGILSTLANSRQKLQEVKRQLSENCKKESQVYEVMRKRIHQQKQRVQQHKKSDSNMDIQSSTRQFHKDIIHYLNCSGRNQQAKVVYNELNLNVESEIQTCLIQETFEIAENITGNNLRPLKNWCVKNTHMLNKINSPLQFHLICCEYLNILNNTEPMTAIQFIRKSIKGIKLTQNQNKTICKLMSYLITKQEDKKIDVTSYLEIARQQFFKNFEQIYKVNLKSNLQNKIGIGITMLKTVCCTKKELLNPKICPICQKKMNDISQKYPMITKHESSIICRINGSLMTESNPPMALPNGQVYSLSGLESTLKQGKYYCITTNTNYHKNLCRKIYLS